MPHSHRMPDDTYVIKILLNYIILLNLVNLITPTLNCIFITFFPALSNDLYVHVSQCKLIIYVCK